MALPEPSLRVPHDEFLVRMPGIGGTGVVTVSRILQMAAHLEGRYAAGVEQTGLAQKGGPVIADVRIADHPVEGTARAGARSVDLLLGFDLLGAASPANLAVTDTDRTVAVVNTAAVPTAAMVRHAVGFPPPRDVSGRIDRETRAAENRYLNAEWIAERISDDHLASNMVLLGAAHQHGCLPLEAGSIEGAIRLNGVAVQENLAAFRWGRAAVTDPAAIEKALASGHPTDGATAGVMAKVVDAGIPQGVCSLVATRVADLADYQSPRYAEGYLQAVADVSVVERTRCPNEAMPVTDAFARGLHKLMAYKDEYEVARLHLLSEEHDRMTQELGPDLRIKVMLHPPILRALGLKRKVSLGPATGPAFRMLRAGRRLRGTPLDPFGAAQMRRTERALVTEYRDLVATALRRLAPDTVDLVAQVAALPELVRGYEEVKAAGIERFRTEGARLMRSLGDGSLEDSGSRP